ncbi:MULTISPECIES: FAD-binding oxidoreductase [Paracoccus]|uniref:NAD(P)/FAD-dependent oxidoreductase n=1 Tax=Paracoccus TaxID=265 RepID=UPI0008686FE9|nr:MULTISPECIES: FAD-binding oxidoreductase [Paracoccus]ODT60519.1 MAG: oxidoreductase [Paracoccus sp. SCN 68-21]
MNLLHLNDRPGAYPPSLYAAQCGPQPDLPPLQGEARADVAVIGAGYTGLSAALHLARRGLSVTVLEAQRVGFGASGRNGGQIGSGQRQEVDWLEAKLGRDMARRLWDLAEEAKTAVRDIAAEAGVPVRDGIAHACRTAAEVDHARHMADHLARHYDYGQVASLDRDALAAALGSTAYVGGDLDRGAGHVHPLALTLGMARLARDAGAVIHERSQVTGLTHGAPSTIRTDQGVLRADHVILACNGYLGDLDRGVAARVMPINNYIVTTPPLDDHPEILPDRIAAADTKFVVNYWRLDDERRLVFGGGETVTYRFPRDIAAVVRPHLLSVYPQLRDVPLTHAWGGTLAITMNRMPCFTRPAPNCLSASGYSGHGVAMATLAGRLMAEAVAGQADRFDAMAAVPTRPFPGGAALRKPLLVAGMAWFGLRDRLGL